MVKAWEDAVLSSTAAAIAHASQMQDLTHQYNHIVQLEAATRMRSQELNQAKQALQAWLSTQAQAGSQAPLDTLQRWQMLTAAGRVVDLNPTEQILLETAPATDAPASAYVEWVGSGAGFSRSQPGYPAGSGGRSDQPARSHQPELE